jgi:hypothetical protein
MSTIEERIDKLEEDVRNIKDLFIEYQKIMRNNKGS